MKKNHQSLSLSLILLLIPLFALARDPVELSVYQKNDRYSEEERNDYLKTYAISVLINQETFIVLSPLHAKDATKVFFKEILISDADPTTFSVINSTSNKELNYAYTKDAKHVFLQGVIIKEADPFSIEVLKSKSAELTYAKDKNHVFRNHSIIFDADPDSYQPIKDNLDLDKNNAYIDGVKVKDSDSQTFVKMPSSFNQLSRDINHIYYKGKKIERSDGRSFTFMHRDKEDLFKDKNHVYYKDTVADGIISQDFKLLFVVVKQNRTLC